MSVEHWAAVWKTDAKILSGLTRLVMLAIADNADHNGRAYPGIDHLAEKTGVSARHVRRLIQELEALRLIKVARQNGCGNVYVINSQAVEKLWKTYVNIPATQDTMSPDPGHHVPSTQDTMSPDPYIDKEDIDKDRNRYLFDPAKTDHWPASFKQLMERFLAHTTKRGVIWTREMADTVTAKVEQRGIDQATNDLEFSLLKGYKSYCQAPSANQFQTTSAKKTSSANALDRLNQRLGENANAPS